MTGSEKAEFALNLALFCGIISIMLSISFVIVRFGLTLGAGCG